MKKKEKRIIPPYSQCVICHKKGPPERAVYDTKMICKECLNAFTEEELQLMIDLFNKYGGWFNKLGGKEKFSFKKAMPFLVKEGKKKGWDMIEINAHLIHKGLLHGIRYSEYLKSLDDILKDSE